jgi:hypothetical protein
LRSVLAIVAVSAALGAVACGGSGSAASTSQSAGASLAAGEAIFRTGAHDGRPIPRTGSNGGMMNGGGMGGGMMAGGCATCHGPGGRGRTTQAFSAPDITHTNLTDLAGMLMLDGSRGLTYTDDAIRAAVIEGIDPEGDKLAQPMPQWQLSDQEWGALLAYRKTLQ